MLTFQVFRANPNATVDVIAEEVLDGIFRANELRQSTQVVSPFVSSLMSCQSIPMDTFSFLEQEIIARCRIVSEKEKVVFVRKYELDSSSSED
jgi:hypothetical protein